VLKAVEGEEMKRLLLGIVILMLMVSSGYCKDQPLQLTIKTDKPVYSDDENIAFGLTIKNASLKVIEYIYPSDGACLEMWYRDENRDELIPWNILIVIDGKEYKTTGPCVWGGPSYALHQGEEKVIVMNLTAFGITKDMILGRHSIVVRINGATSNTITIEVSKNKCVSDKECINIDCSKFDKPGIKEGYKPYCVEEKCKCMCYGCD
jgi:hypothetical protein